MQTIIRMDLRLAEDHLDGPPLANDPSSFSLSLFLHLRKKYSKYFPPFLPWVSSPQQKNIFSFSKVQIFPSFSFTAKKTYFPPPLPFSSPPQKKHIFLLQIFSSFFLPHISSPPQKIHLSFSNLIFLFVPHFIFLQQNNRSPNIIFLFHLCSSSPLKTRRNTKSL